MAWISNLGSNGYSPYPFDTASGKIGEITLPTAHEYQYVDALFNSLRYYAQVTISDTGSITGNYFGQASATWYYGTVTWSDPSLEDLTDKIAVTNDLYSTATQSIFRIIFIVANHISGQHPDDTSESQNGYITEYVYNNGVHSMTFYFANYQWYQMDYQGSNGRIQLRYLDGVTQFIGLNAFDLVDVTSYHSLEKATSTARYDMYSSYGGYGGTIDLFACYSSSILIPRFNAYFTTSGSSATTDSTVSHGIYNLYDQNGQLIVYDSSKTYILENLKRYNGELIGGGGYYLVNNNGYLAFEQSNYGYIYPYVIQYLAL